jgi:hypothetical protein
MRYQPLVVPMEHIDATCRWRTGQTRCAALNEHSSAFVVAFDSAVVTMRVLDLKFRQSLRMGPKYLLATIIALLFCQSASAQSALFTSAERARLIELTRQNAAAQTGFAKLKGMADAALKATPNPIRKIQTEGKLAGDPVKIATQTSLRDMRALAVLGYAYEITGEAKYAEKTREFIMAWVETNQPTGNPIDETNLEPLLVAYDQTRDTFSRETRETADAYLRKIIRAEQGARQVINNWQSHRVKIVGLAAYVLKDDVLIAQAIKGFKDQIAANLKPDGSSYDFHERDALHYHVYDLEPLLTLAIAAHNNGLNLYDFPGKDGASLRRSVQFLIPYCTGEKEHHEFVHSNVEFDRKRATNGEKGYQTGHLFRPEEGFNALSLAAYLDESVNPIVARLAGQNTNLMGTWTLILVQASRPN